MNTAWRFCAAAALCIGGLIAAPVSTHAQGVAEQLRLIEHERLRSLVDADVEVAQRLHADDFQLINPAGIAWSKEQYLGGIASGAFDYRVWEPDGEIQVRLYGDAAVLRYPAQLEIVVAGQEISLRGYWHTDLYELRSGEWQVVWSQATERPPRPRP